MTISGKSKPILVSVCIPIKNGMRFLPQRKQSIINQTYEDYEVIALDDYSEDGSVEFVKQWAAEDSRVQLFHGPNQGLYAGWNATIAKASGEFIYIAPADDTIEPAFLEEMVKALIANPSCEIAHCCATFIDEDDVAHPGLWERWNSVRFYGDQIKKHHVRPVFYDTVVASAYLTPYFSISQILLRRTIFDKGLWFSSAYLTYGDLDWQMRATMISPTVHLPKYLATWRMHGMQASRGAAYFEAMGKGVFLDLIKDNIENACKLYPKITIKSNLLAFAKFNQFAAKFFLTPMVGKPRLLLAEFLTAPRIAWKYVCLRLSGKPVIDSARDRELRQCLACLGLNIYNLEGE